MILLIPGETRMLPGSFIQHLYRADILYLDAEITLVAFTGEADAFDHFVDLRFPVLQG
jgi:hypothetical protein